MSTHPRRLSRREFIAETSALAVVTVAGATAAAEPEARQAMGTKVGEVTPTSAIVWTRLTAAAARNNAGVVPPKLGKKEVWKATVPVPELEGACPGAAGRVRLRYGLGVDLSDAKATEWQEVSAAGDFAHQFALADLQPGSVYHYASETAAGGGGHGAFRGRFHTAPKPDAETEVRFCVSTCYGYPDRDHPDGHPIWPAMLAAQPHFVCYTGDNVYYDNDAPVAETVELARYHWQRMFSLPRPVALLREVAAYFQKDDHDVLRNDCAPGAKLGQVTFAEGQEIYRQQVPIAGLCYRTFRWGRDLQIWLTEGRDFRTPNFRPDGPEKSIWGAEQKEWFKRTFADSDATWKVLVSPTPIVGPDRGNKNDNHANTGFRHEGDELRAWLKEHGGENAFVVCGDRHWQYHSVHPETGVREFACGPASNSHASGSPGEDPTYHKYHRVKGGFLVVTVRREAGQKVVVCEHRDVTGAVQHTWRGVRA